MRLKHLALLVPFALAPSALMWAGCNSDQGTTNGNFPTISQHPANGSGVESRPTPRDRGGGTDATVVPPAVATACGDLAVARCQRSDQCTGGRRNVAVYGSEAACEARTTAACVLDLAAPSTAQTAAGVEACATSVKTQSCADLFDEVPTSACVPVAGTLTTGAACITGSQCASTFCSIGPNAVCGSCATLPKAGDACATTEQCGERGGLTCAAGKCIPIGQSGSACTSAIPCGFGLSCVGASASAPGTCQAAGADAGVACDPTEGSGAACAVEQGLECDPGSRTCVLVAYVDGGGACGALDGGTVGCAAGACVIAAVDAGPPVDAAVVDAGDGGDADVDAATTPVDAAPPPAPTVGVCVAAATEGNACDLMLGPPCLAPAQCVLDGDGGSAGKCALANGATCK
jgi:hypothetical protein